MFAIPWIAVFLAAPIAWFPALRWLTLGLLGVAYVVALANGPLDTLALIPLALLLLAALAVKQRQRLYLQFLGHVLFIALAIALSLHWLPGFHNPLVIGPVRFSPDAAPFTMYLNLDKPLIFFWLMLVLPWIRQHHGVLETLGAGIGGMLGTSAACLLIALLLGIVAWEPKWPAVAWLWLLNNLLMVTFTEEALFRGYLQGGLRRLLRGQSRANVISLGIASLLFGISHAPGGWQWVVLGTIAGIGYGLAFRFGGLRAAVLAHFGLNVTHFLLFTYPMLAAP
ncbi:CPBP family intramembrane glutamic endopeptidase [Paraburkholderia sp. DHOC27]|uniref:CPBP family intramembrane glutamic endopeptidase n=1 Tax=Paraburkholderia sp. DHOC27 TaxID=2303330 RepID=UPI000E3D0A71|nr:CPBP family intramembrane glutamic endopeptidase [Paraburkholderia sp. DHOC27]RFU49287.1 CPBP family intramembrane metalloprotease [Paraburkholderia sp. DHOC27]